MNKKWKIVVTGASGHLGKALKEKLPATALAQADIRFLDDEVLDGTLTEYDGGVEMIRALTVEAFEGTDLAFFCGTQERSAEYIALVRETFGEKAPRIIDLSGAVSPRLTSALPRSTSIPRDFGIPEALATGLAHLLDICAALAPLEFVQATAFLPVSTFGDKGVDALQNQFVELANFGEVSKEIFERQVMFNIVPSHGMVSAAGQSGFEKRVIDQVRDLLANPVLPLHLFTTIVPVFYSIAVSMTVKFDQPVDGTRLRKAFEHVHGFALETKATKAHPLAGPLESTGREELVISRLAEIPGSRSAYAFWFNFDNVTTGAVNQAIKLAERALAETDDK